MPSARRNPSNLLLAGLCLASLAGCGTATQLTGGDYGSYSTYATGGNGALSLFVEPNDGATPILDAINQARSSVQVEVYMLTDQAIEGALGAAAKRGVNVQVMLDPTPYNPSDPNKPLTTNQAAAQTLKSQGVKVQWSDPAFRYTHAKTIVVDGQEALICTLNFTNSGVGGNREYGVVDRNPQDVQDLVNIFAADWNRTTYTPTSPDLVVSPTNSQAKLESLFQSAQQSIVLQDEEFSDPTSIALLGQKAHQGVKVEVDLAAPTDIPDNATTAQQLEQLGVSVRYLASPTIHAKMIVVDGVRGYIGSVNLSTNSMTNNREVGLLMTDPGILQTLTSTFTSDWQNSQPFASAGPVNLQPQPQG